MKGYWTRILNNGRDKDKYGAKWAELTAQGWSIGGLTFSFEAVLLAVSDKKFQNDLNKSLPY